jgi:hypothetical protein
MEEQPVNTVLATLHATDADSTISEYQLIDGNSDADNGSNEYFEINNVTGKQSIQPFYLYKFYFFVLLSIDAALSECVSSSHTLTCILYYFVSFYFFLSPRHNINNAEKVQTSREILLLK